jgi:hypothetical protein
MKQGNVPNFQYGVWCKPLTTNPIIFEDWKTSFRKISFAWKEYGWPKIAGYLYCSFCHGRDHTRGLCPFARLPDWIGPSGAPRNILLCHNPDIYPEYGVLAKKDDKAKPRDRRDQARGNQRTPTAAASQPAKSNANGRRP